MFSDALFRKFKYNENIRKSKYSTENDKIEAWKKNKLILEHLYQNEQNPEVRNELLSKHFKEISIEKYARDHYDETVMKSSAYKDAREKDDDVIIVSDLNSSTFEPSTHRDYNQQTEILQTQNNFINVQKPHILQSPSPLPTTNAVKKKKFDIEAKDGRWGTMANFLIKPKDNTNHIERIKVDEKPRTSKTNNEQPTTIGFRTALEEMQIRSLKNNGNANNASTSTNTGSSNQHINFGATKKSLGARLIGRAKFNVPNRSDDVDTECSKNTSNNNSTTTTTVEIVQDERYKNIDPKMIELIMNEIIHKLKPIDWSDIAGLDYAKYIIREAAVLPQLRPDIYKGLRGPPRGILLFGPPGTGKTLIGKCIASQSQSTFFSISASSLTSKYVGEGEKMVRALFAVAAVQRPSVIFIDEIDSLLTQRSESEHESTRRLKTEFLVQLDGVASAETDRIVVVGATNRPQELDEAARRRLVRRLYIPLPEIDARKQILTNMLLTVRNNLSDADVTKIAEQTNGYSGADMESLCREASMQPLRSIPVQDILHFKEENIRDVDINDFNSALQCVRPSVSPNEIQHYIEWNRLYGSVR